MLLETRSSKKARETGTVDPEGLLQVWKEKLKILTMESLILAQDER